MFQIKIKTWTCPECDYQQDFEPTIENMTIHFKGWGIGDYDCPACLSGRNESSIKKKVKMKKETDNTKKSVMNIAEFGDETEVPVLDIDKKETIDSQGNTITKIRKLKREEYKTDSEIQEIKDKYED